MSEFSNLTETQLWDRLNDRSAAASYRIAVEDELNRRGIDTRDDDGHVLSGP